METVRFILEIPNHIHKSHSDLKILLEHYDGEEIDINFIEEIPHFKGTAIIQDWLTEIKKYETDPYKLFTETYGNDDDQYHFYLSGWSDHKKMLELKEKFKDTDLSTQ